MLPIRDLCATAFCILLSFVFYYQKNVGAISNIATDAMFTLRDWWICVIDQLRCANDSVNGVDCSAPTCCLSAIFVRPLFCILLSFVFYYKKNLCAISNIATDAMFTLRDWWICVIDQLRCANDGACSSHGDRNIRLCLCNNNNNGRNGSCLTWLATS